jgi:hypothetical protein
MRPLFLQYDHIRDVGASAKPDAADLPVDAMPITKEKMIAA